MKAKENPLVCAIIISNLKLSQTLAMDKKYVDKNNLLWCIDFLITDDNSRMLQFVLTLLDEHDVDYEKYFKKSLMELSINVARYFYDNNIKLSEDDWHECILEICRLNDIELFEWIYSIKKEQIDTNIEEYFLTSFENGHIRNSLYKYMYVTCNINTKNFTDDLIYEAFNYGNKKAVTWLLTVGEEVKNKFELLRLCDFEDLNFYSQFVDIDKTLGRDLILAKIKNCIYINENDNYILFLLSLHKYDFSNHIQEIYDSNLKRNGIIYKTLIESISSDNLPAAMPVNNDDIPTINAFPIEQHVKTNWLSITNYFN